ncbi:MAG: hypothetical protein Kow00120_26010 [Anaerolineae bacterium]
MWVRVLAHDGIRRIEARCAMSFMAALVLLLAAAPSVAAPARQSMTYPIAYGQSARNLINHRHHAWLYYFEARRGDRVTITVDALDGDLDPFISLRDAAGNVLAEDDDSGPGTNARLVYDVRRDGRYDIFVTRYQGELAPSAGRFELRLEGMPNGMFGPPPAGREVIGYGQGASANLTAGQPAAWYVFAGWRGDTVNLGVALRNGNFTPKAEVYLPGSARPFLDLTADASRRILAEGVTLPLTGYYAIRVAAAPTDAAGVDGGVQISLQGAAGTPPERQEGAQIDNLPPGADAEGVLSNAAPERHYAFHGAQGQFVRATMTVTDGDLSPLLMLLDANGDTVAFDDTPGEAQIAQARLPRAGEYLLVAGRVQGEGAYRLVMQPLAGGELALTEGAVSVTVQWDGAADLDLIVRDPAGDALSPQTRQVASGGVLQVDANAACAATMPDPIEHAYWPASAPAGVYEVIVWNRDTCGAHNPVPFALVVTVDGETVAQVQDELPADGQYRTTITR